MLMYPEVMFLSSTESIFFVIHKGFPSLLLQVLLLGVSEMQNCLDKEEDRNRGLQHLFAEAGNQVHLTTPIA